MNKTLVVSLVGFSGSGKSTIGKLLARKRRMRFLDTDALIEKQLGEPIDKVLSSGHEKRFRAVERSVLEDVYSNSSRSKVVALGGGAFQSVQNRRLIRAAGPTVYLSCSVRELYRRLQGSYDRPLLKVVQKPGMTMREARMMRIQTLLAERRDTYELADIHVSVTSRTAHESVDMIDGILESM